MKVPSLMMFVVELFVRKVFDMPCMGPAGVTFAPPIQPHLVPRYYVRSYMYVVASSSKFLASYVVGGGGAPRVPQVHQLLRRPL